MTEKPEGEPRMRLANQYETFLRSMLVLRGDHISADQMGQIVDRAVASASPEERRSPVPSPDALNRLQQFLSQATEAGRPRNDFSAEAARAAQAPGAHGGLHGGHGFDRYDGQRGSSARYREIGANGSDGTRAGNGSGNGSGTGNLTGSGVTPEFARSFAGTGMVGGTLRTFAEVGLDRGTFNQFRKEGFSKEQIVDSAKDTKALGWKGKDDLSIAQHASTDVRKAAVVTEQAKTEADRVKGLAHEAELEKKNEARPDSDPQKKHNQRFFERQHQDHLRHDAKAGLGTESRQRDAALSTPKARPDAVGQQAQDGTMAKEAKKQTA